jgi:serine/threonine protein kinase
MAGEQADGPAYLVREFVDGQSLAQRLASGPMGAADVALLGRQLAETLTYLHGRGVVHRDIKPANILLQAAADGPERARLTDFGVARLLDSSRITSVGTTVGTANYLSPEQATGAEVGPPADIYALGLVLLECLTGQVAYPGSGVEAAVARLHRPPHIPAAIGPGWVRLLRMMTAHDPAARPSAAEVDAEIVRLPVDGPGNPRTRTWALPEQSSPHSGETRILAGAADTEPPAVMRLRRSWWTRPLVWVGVVAVAVAATLAVTFTRGGGSSAQPRPSPRPTTSQQPNYPTVPGQLGQDLKKLEEAVG